MKCIEKRKKLKEAMVVIQDVTKYYDDFLAVDTLNLKVEKGEFYGLLGPNGAGKTTTIKMLTMLLYPTEGEIKIAGHSLHRGTIEVKSMIGVVPQHFSLQRDMNVEETLWHHGLLHHMKRKEIKTKINQLLVFAGMEDFRKKTVAKLSGGNKRKLMMIRALMHEPKILFLDEPTVGLDATIRRTIWDLLKKLKSEGLTIVLTTHYIEEARILCDKIGMMNHGKIQMENTPAGFLKTIPEYTVEVFDGDETVYSYFRTRNLANEYASCVEGDVYIRRTNLEDVYVSITDERVGGI